MSIMRALSCLTLLNCASALAAATPAAPSYRLATTIAGPDGAWDLTSVDPVGRRLYVARSEAIEAIDLDTGRVTPALVPAQRGHAALAIPGMRHYPMFSISRWTGPARRLLRRSH